jgi:hypothetical protein
MNKEYSAPFFGGEEMENKQIDEEDYSPTGRNSGRKSHMNMKLRN